MIDEMGNEVNAFYSGVEPIELGNLEEVKEQRTLIPATKNVKFKIKKADNFVSKDNTFRMINLQLQLIDGIDENGKYKNKVMFARVSYYADPTKYTSDFFKNKQHLVQLKYLLRSIGATTNIVDGHLLDELMNSQPIMADITIKKSIRKIDDGTGTGTFMEVEQMENDIRNFKAAGATATV
jgi:hypothetical protein